MSVIASFLHVNAMDDGIYCLELGLEPNPELHQRSALSTYITSIKVLK